jgi:hypothetical protein
MAVVQLWQPSHAKTSPFRDKGREHGSQGSPPHGPIPGETAEAERGITDTIKPKARARTNKGITARREIAPYRPSLDGSFHLFDFMTILAAKTKRCAPQRPTKANATIRKGTFHSACVAKTTSAPTEHVAPAIHALRMQDVQLPRFAQTNRTSMVFPANGHATKSFTVSPAQVKACWPIFDGQGGGCRSESAEDVSSLMGPKCLSEGIDECKMRSNARAKCVHGSNYRTLGATTSIKVPDIPRRSLEHVSSKNSVGLRLCSIPSPCGAQTGSHQY